jgi:7,8-dihydro-6-hydroxymethylpterin-pyrophosphokinase
MISAVIGIGSNLNRPLLQLRQAVKYLQAQAELQIYA